MPIFLHSFHIYLIISHNVLQVSIYLSHRRLLPVRITCLELFLSPRHLFRSTFRRGTLLGSEIRKKSLGSMSGQYGGWIISTHPKDLIRFLVQMAELGLALSRRSRQKTTLLTAYCTSKIS